MAEQTSSGWSWRTACSYIRRPEGKEYHPLCGFIIALKISCFCLRGGLDKAKCHQNTSTSCSTMQELWGQCRVSYRSAFLGQKETVGQGCCGTWGKAWAGQEGGAGLWGQKSLQMWKQSQSLGSFRMWDFYSGRIEIVLVWNTIFPIVRDFWNAIARQCISSGMLQESRGTRAPSRLMAHIVPDLQHWSLSHRVLRQNWVHPPLSTAELPPGLHLSKVCALTLV